MECIVYWPLRGETSGFAGRNIKNENDRGETDKQKCDATAAANPIWV